MMDVADIRSYCLAKPGTSDDMPFDDTVIVARVLGKIFAFLPLDTIPTVIALKCDPERAVELRERYEAIRPGFHLNKKHWNSITCDGSVPASMIRELIDHSYDLVAKGLSKRQRDELAVLGERESG